MTPVVFIHWGYRAFLNKAISQALKYVQPVIEFMDQQQKYGSMEIDRWFVLEKYMREGGLDRVLYLDSDVLLFADPTSHFTDCDMAFSQFHSGHTMFINNRQALTDFCKYIDANIDNLNLINETKIRLPNNVFADTMGDMVLLNNFVYNSDYTFRDTNEPVLGTIYSHNYNTEESSITRDYKYTLPQYTDEFGKRHVLNSIHFQGGAKEKMKEFTYV